MTKIRGENNYIIIENNFWMPFLPDRIKETCDP